MWARGGVREGDAIYAVSAMLLNPAACCSIPCAPELSLERRLDFVV